jgi:hypothetical protein
MREGRAVGSGKTRRVSAIVKGKSALFAEPFERLRKRRCKTTLVWFASGPVLHDKLSVPAIIEDWERLRKPVDEVTRCHFDAFAEYGW